MAPDFEPICRNPHLLTIAGNFWPRKIDLRRFPATRTEYKIDQRTTILAFAHQPENSAAGQIVLLHGLEGCADAGYIQSFAQEALTRGFGVHRLNMRTCGGTEELCETMYHSGLTSDTREILERIRARFHGPVFLTGFSLGGNVALKLAGELGGNGLLSGVCGISTPLDLAACVRAVGKRSNVLYARRFLDRLRARVRRKSKIAPHLYKTEGLEKVRTIWDFDDLFTAPLFGFGTAENYYATQSSKRFIGSIRTPTLLIAAKDDPIVPFSVYEDPAIQRNPFVTLIAPEHGGHLGFLSRRRPRFWIDRVCLDWIQSVAAGDVGRGTNVPEFTSA